MDLKKGAVVTCEVIEVKEGGIDVKIVGTDLSTFIKRSELARDRADQRPERFAVGEKVDVRVTLFDRKARKIAVSIKALESGRREGGHRAIWLRRFGRFARRHSRRRPEGARRGSAEKESQGRGISLPTPDVNGSRQ